MKRAIRTLGRSFFPFLLLGASLWAFAPRALLAQNLLSAPAFHPFTYSPAFSISVPPLPKPSPALTFNIPPVPKPFPTFALDLPEPQARAVPPQRDVSWKLLPRNFLEDQKDMWITFPAHLFHGQHVLPTFSIIAATGGLIATDPYDTPYFRRTYRFEDFNSAFSKYNTDAFLAVGPATVYVVGLFRKDTFAQKTALFSGEAAADAMVFYAVAQEATHRRRPIEIPPNGDFGDSFYDGHKGLLSNSFPSGHAAEAFAIATVFERRYREHKWVPWVAYGVAAAICFSRITIQSHFPSDVFMGAAIGYTVGRYVALQGR